jgi:hypothetical protein
MFLIASLSHSGTQRLPCAMNGDSALFTGLMTLQIVSITLLAAFFVSYAHTKWPANPIATNNVERMIAPHPLPTAQRGNCQRSGAVKTNGHSCLQDQTEPQQRSKGTHTSQYQRLQLPHRAIFNQSVPRDRLFQPRAHGEGAERNRLIDRNCYPRRSTATEALITRL